MREVRSVRERLIPKTIGNSTDISIANILCVHVRKSDEMYASSTCCTHAKKKKPRPMSRIIGSAEALPILCVSDFCETLRGRERERDACDVIRYPAEIASDHAYDYLDGASTRSEPVECSCIRQGAWCLSARAAGNGRVIYEWRWVKLCVRWWACRGSPSTISLACFKQEE